MDIKTYTKKEALILMIVHGETMKHKSNDEFYYYYLDGKFYGSGVIKEWNPNESSNDVEWVIIK